MFVWSKLSAAKWIDAWEDRFHGNPNFVLDFLKGGKSVRVQVYCESKKAADAIVEQFGGSVRKLVSSEWQKPGLHQVKQPITRIKILLTGKYSEQNSMMQILPVWPLLIRNSPILMHLIKQDYSIIN
ncbi:MAG: hypothetical protein EOP84_23645 [Verrucomicrobiaceae bacterium]|nr:MAG: hypothetical protein EOP84_23645 [Verrucomicrobiaceae bacterium]